MTTLNARIVHLHNVKPGAIPSAEQLGAIGTRLLSLQFTGCEPPAASGVFTSCAVAST